MMGITYRGKHSRRDLGVIVRTVTRPVLPPSRISEETIPYRDGSLDYSEQGGRLFYDDKIVEIEVSMVDKSLPLLHRRIAKVAAWIAGGFGELIFDDMPYIVWQAKPIDVDGIAPQLLRVGKTVVQFRCRPFNHLVFNSQGVKLDSRVRLDADIPLDYGAENEITVVNGTQTLSYEYAGDAPVRPDIVISGPMREITVGINGNQLIIRVGIPFDTYGGVLIDCENWRCIGMNGGPVDMVSGDFMELVPGENSITTTCSYAGTMRLVFFTNYLYGSDF